MQDYCTLSFNFLVNKAANYDKFQEKNKDLCLDFQFFDTDFKELHHEILDDNTLELNLKKEQIQNIFKKNIKNFGIHVFLKIRGIIKDHMKIKVKMCK